MTQTEVVLVVAVFGVVAPFVIGCCIAVTAQYYDYKSFKKQTVEKLEQVDKHLESVDTRHEEVKTLLLEIRQNQTNHQNIDNMFFEKIDKRLDKIDLNFENIWKQK